MDPTVRKIDFFGGLHGNYLELVVNVFIDKLEFDLKRPMFTETGACHLKNRYPDYQPITKSSHWSYFKIPFADDDRVIRINLKKQDMLIAVTNSFLRANDQCVDIQDLEKNTLAKIKNFPKLRSNMDQITKDFGIKDDYSRSSIRNYFYSMFHDDENGIDLYRCFDPTTRHYHEFPFRAFFNFADFLVECNRVAKFVELAFMPTEDLWQLHQEFLAKNQGYHSEIKCQEIIRSIFSRTSMPLNLNLVEEAWINYQLSQIVDFYDEDFLNADQYPADTRYLSEIVFDSVKHPR